MNATAKDWRTLPAGRELDAIMAERMGAQWWRSSATGNRALFMEKPPEWFTQRADGTEGRVGDWNTYGGFPAYSTDVAAAVQLAESFASRGYFVSLTYNALTGTWWAGIGGQSDCGPIHQAGTPALAIARAALAATEAR